MLEFNCVVLKEHLPNLKGVSLYGKKPELDDRFEFIMIKDDVDEEYVKFYIKELFEVEKERFLSEYEYIDKYDCFSVFKKKEIVNE